MKVFCDKNMISENVSTPFSLPFHSILFPYSDTVGAVLYRKGVIMQRHFQGPVASHHSNKERKCATITNEITFLNIVQSIHPMPNCLDSFRYL